MLNVGRNAIVVNSFSKYFCMPGWRLGWVIIPESLKKNFLKLSQNLFISSGNIAQYSAIKVFECLKELNELVNEYHHTRDSIYKIIKDIPVIDFKLPSGSFYYYLDISRTGLNSFNFVDKLMHDTGVVLTPGKDFDKTFGDKTVRLSFSSKSEVVLEATEVMYDWFKNIIDSTNLVFFPSFLSLFSGGILILSILFVLFLSFFSDSISIDFSLFKSLAFCSVTYSFFLWLSSLESLTMSFLSTLVFETSK